MEGIVWYVGSGEGLESILGHLKSILQGLLIIDNIYAKFFCRKLGGLNHAHTSPPAQPPPFDDTIYHVTPHAGRGGTRAHERGDVISSHSTRLARSSGTNLEHTGNNTGTCNGVTQFVAGNERFIARRLRQGAGCGQRGHRKRTGLGAPSRRDGNETLAFGCVGRLLRVAIA